MHDVVPLILLHLVRARKMTGGVVRTFSQSVLLKRIAAAHNLKLYETPIGFKYIADLMLNDDILIGAEESGGIGVKGHIPERDGILNSLLFLEAIVTAGKPPSEMLQDLHREFGEFHFGRRDLHVETSVGQKLIERLAKAAPQNLRATTLAASKPLTVLNCCLTMSRGCCFDNPERNRCCEFIRRRPAWKSPRLC